MNKSRYPSFRFSPRGELQAVADPSIPAVFRISDDKNVVYVDGRVCRFQPAAASPVKKGSQEFSFPWSFASLQMEVRIAFPVEQPFVLKTIRIVNGGRSPVTLQRVNLWDFRIREPQLKTHAHFTGERSFRPICLFLRGEESGLFVGAETPHCHLSVDPAHVCVFVEPAEKLNPGEGYESKTAFLGMYRREHVLWSTEQAQGEAFMAGPLENLDLGEVRAMQAYIKHRQPSQPVPIHFVQAEQLQRPPESTVTDLHRDSLVIVAHDHILDNQGILKMKSGGVDMKGLMVSVDTHIWASPEEFVRSIHAMDGFLEPTLQEIDRIHDLCRQQPEHFRVIRSSSDIVAAQQAGQCGLLLGIEGGKPIGRSLNGLYRLYDAGVRHVQLTWAFRNLLAAGQDEPDDGGLTDFGRQVVREMNRLGMVTDVTHLSVRSFWDVLELSEKPVVLSHGGARSFCPDQGNLNDDQLKALADGGGVVGIHFCSHIVKAPNTIATVDDVVDHISYLVDMIGIDHVGIGGDYFPYNDKYIETQEVFMEVVDAGDRENVGLIAYPKGLESIETLANLTCCLWNRGYKAEEIQKILGLNFLRLYREVFD